MKNLIRNQQGVTFIGWLIILAIIAFFVLLVLRLWPLYNEKFIVESAMKSVSVRPGIDKADDREVLKQFLRTVQVGGSRRFHSNNIKEYAKIEKPKTKGGNRLLNIKYESTNIFFQDIEFLLRFDKSYELKGG